MTSLALVVAALVTGTLIGTVGIGGVLLVPSLVLIGGLAVHEATPIATLSFVFTGIAGTVAYGRAGRIDWPITKWLLLASIPGAIAGVATNVALSATAITIVIAAVLGAAAMQAFRARPFGASSERRSPSVAALVTIGVVVGFGSTLSGTGGPVLLIPMMVLAGAAVGAAVSSSQPIQLPIAAFGSASFLAYGTLDWPLALVLGVVQGAGAVGGARVSSRLPTAMLRLLVAWALVISSIVFIVKAVVG